MPGLMEANTWEAQRPLPRFFWNAQMEMSCLRGAIRRAIDTGYNHHIERLTLLWNFCLLAGIRPSAVNDWFLSIYVDAYEWVMAPNVPGMGLNADGGLIATRPYIASANYIHKMSDTARTAATIPSSVPATKPARSTSSTGAFSCITRPGCGPIPGWVAAYWAFVHWARISGRQFAPGRLFLAHTRTRVRGNRHAAPKPRPTDLRS
jgi:hypothetical protein